MKTRTRRDRRWSRWTPEQDNMISNLVVKYPNGTRGIKWSKLVKDPMWKWPEKSAIAVRDRYKNVPPKPEVVSSQPKPKRRLTSAFQKAYPSVNFCLHCGKDLSSVYYIHNRSKG